MVERVDVLVVGAGIAGAAIAFELAVRGVSVRLLEREAQPGYHSTGRSAAMLIDSYGTPALRALARVSRPFLEQPPAGFTAEPLLTPRGILYIARADQRAALQHARDEAVAAGADVRLLGGEAIRDLVPALDFAYVEAALFEPGAMAIDVAALHQGYLKGLARHGGRLVTDAEITAIDPTGRGFEVETRAGRFAADVLVDAAGAWADELAKAAGVRPVGLVPKRRTAILIDPPDAMDPASWPMVMDVEEEFYFKPEAGRLLVSPADQTPVAPSDVQPEELDVAIAVDRYQQATGRTVARIAHRWAGLRSFVADEDPVFGFDRDRDGFFWLGALGGSGIMAAPALGRLGAALITGEPHAPFDLERLSPDRLRG